jgi:hypothetical protein
MAHDFDKRTDYCMKCGCALGDFVDDLRPFCDEVGNVSGVSHIIAGRRMDAMVSAYLEGPKKNEQCDTARPD